MHKAYFRVYTNKISCSKLGRRPEIPGKPRKFWLSVRMNQDDVDNWIRLLKYLKIEVENPMSSQAFREFLRICALHLDVIEADKRLKHMPFSERKFWESIV